MNQSRSMKLDLILVTVAWLILSGLTGFLVVLYAQIETEPPSVAVDLVSPHDLERLVERLETEE